MNDTLNLTTNPATTDIDKALSMLAVAIARMKTARAAERGDDDEWNEKLVRDLATLAHRLDPGAIMSINLLLGGIGMRLVVPEVEYRETRELRKSAHRVMFDTPVEARGLLVQALRHLNALVTLKRWGL